MPLQSDADKVAEQIRTTAWEDMVAEYRLQYAENPEWTGLNVRGHEVPDPIPMDPPIGYQPGPDLIEQIRAMVRTELSRKADEEGMETFAEADDFDIDDDIDPTSPYEQFFDPPPGSPAGPQIPPATPPGEQTKGEARTSDQPLADPPGQPSADKTSNA